MARIFKAIIRLIFGIQYSLRKVIHKLKLFSVNLKKLGNNVDIREGFQFDWEQNISIYDNVYIGPNSFISAHGDVVIGSGTIIGPRISIYTANHNYKNDIESIPYDHQLLIKPVKIESNCWVGSNVIILPGVKIGEGSIIAAGAVIHKSVEPFSIVGGNPSKFIKKRENIDDYMSLKSKNKIYFKLKNSK